MQTKYIHTFKPTILGREDLATPRVLEAPSDYDPGYDASHKNGHAVIITVNSFVYNDYIPDIPENTTKEHETLHEILSHDFICKFPPERCTSLLNPTCAQFIALFKYLRNVCKSNDYLIIYICSHIVTAYKGEKGGGGNRDENGYLLMCESEWTNPQKVAETSISIGTIISLLNTVLTKG
jgi:hypothetical protein